MRVNSPETAAMVTFAPPTELVPSLAAPLMAVEVAHRNGITVRASGNGAAWLVVGAAFMFGVVIGARLAGKGAQGEEAAHECERSFRDAD